LELRKKKVKSVLISTVRSSQTSPKAVDVRMRFSLDGELIDNKTYEFKTPLDAGAVVTARGDEVEYVGE
jgi:hypothetical protein